MIADQNEGMHFVNTLEPKDNKNSFYMKDISATLNKSPSRVFEPFGKISFFAMSAKKNLLVLYTEAESKGRIIVLPTDLSKELNRLETNLLDAKGLTWTGTDLPLLSYPDKIVLVGPNSFEI